MNLSRTRCVGYGQRLKIYNGQWDWGRPSIAELWLDLRDVTRRVRPDCNITTPEFRDT